MICGPYGGVDAALNVLLFIPFGLGMALGGATARRAILIAFACTVTIELLQVRLVAGRDSSLGDVLTNTLGASLGHALGRFRGLLSRPQPREALRLFAAYLTLWLCAQVLIAYTFTPALPEPPYYGQIDRPRGHSRPAFPGDIVAASVDSLRLVRGGLPNALPIRTLLGSRDGAELRAMATDGGAVSGKAELVVLSGPGMVSVVSLEQEGTSLVYGLRTGAEHLRLRPYEFRMDGVFGARQGRRGDTLLARGRYRTSLVTMSATRGSAVRAREFVPRLSLGWMAFVPLATYVDGDASELALSAIFLLLLAAPAGYWMAMIRAPATSGVSRAPVAASAAVVCVGLFLVPTLFGMHPAAAWEWGCVVLAVACGHSVGRRRARSVPARGG